jgi:polyhydroxyalkanoate synthase
VFDLMAWNADSTRMPYRMHSDLRALLDNDLAEGRYRANRPIALTDIHPVFAVATETDHVASGARCPALLDTDITFLLTSGGHNAGIVSPLANNGRHYRVRSKSERDMYLDPENWLRETPATTGSWWPAWARWLADRSGPFVPAIPVGENLPKSAPLTAAPGSYVLQP